MQKLATPVQYEPALEGLNDIRPLQLADKSKVVIPYPVLCKNPPSTGKPAVGMFARCSQQGALLKSNNRRYRFLEYEYRNYDYYRAKKTITFSQKVSLVLCTPFASVDAIIVRWMLPNFAARIQDISLVEPTVLNFKGTNLHTKAWFSEELGYCAMGFYGYIWDS
ncbi:unnamed protein product [marine sediment metagenome]|uniref:Uncharacterized protein n=1 Tax=marine sediment metagenome TaxID=412755 RepID=X1LKX6_9ZZZZ